MENTQKERLNEEINLLKAKLKCLEDEVNRNEPIKTIGYPFKRPECNPCFTLGDVINYMKLSDGKYFIQGTGGGKFVDEYINKCYLYSGDKFYPTKGSFKHDGYLYEFHYLENGDKVISSVSYEDKVFSMYLLN